MSTRAIAPIVGASNYTVHHDIQSGVKSFTPASAPSADEVDLSEIRHLPRPDTLRVAEA